MGLADHTLPLAEKEKIYTPSSEGDNVTVVGLYGMEEEEEAISHHTLFLSLFPFRGRYKATHRSIMAAQRECVRKKEWG